MKITIKKGNTELYYEDNEGRGLATGVNASELILKSIENLIEQFIKLSNDKN